MKIILIYIYFGETKGMKSNSFQIKLLYVLYISYMSTKRVLSRMFVCIKTVFLQVPHTNRLLI